MTVGYNHVHTIHYYNYLTHTEVTVGFINPPYSAREDEGPMIFTVGVTSGHILDRDIELSFSTVDGLIAGKSLDAHVYLYHPPTHTHTHTHTHHTHPHTQILLLWLVWTTLRL